MRFSPRCRLQAEGGFALIELLISMTVLVVGMFALLATFTSGYTTLNRADVKGSATMLADRTMESYRGKQFTDIAAGTTTTLVQRCHDSSQP